MSTYRQKRYTGCKLGKGCSQKCLSGMYEQHRCRLRCRLTVGCGLDGGHEGECVRFGRPVWKVAPT